MENHNLDWLNAQPEEALAQWFTVALQTYRDGNGELAAFLPLSAGSNVADTTASALASAIALLDKGTQVRFEGALARLMAKWPAADREIWLILIELAWRLMAADAIDILASRASKAFLDTLFGDDERLFSVVVSLVRQTMAYERDSAVGFIYRLVEHRLFRDSDARVTLMSLCERQPGGLARHLAVLRGKLHAQAERLGLEDYDRKLRYWEGVAKGIASTINIDLLADSIADWYLIHGSEISHVSDNWLLFNLPQVITMKAGHGRLLLAPHDHPDSYRIVADFALVEADDVAGDGDLTNPDVAFGPVGAPEPPKFEDVERRLAEPAL